MTEPGHDDLTDLIDHINQHADWSVADYTYTVGHYESAEARIVVEWEYDDGR